MTATLKVVLKEINGVWVATLNGPGVKQRFEYATEEEAHARLREAITRATTLMFDGVVTGIRCARKEVRHAG
jgi:hypothetical protein